MDFETRAAGPDTATLYKVAYDEAARALSEQLTLIDSFRTRAGLLLSAAAITTSFLSARALAAGSLSFASGAALTSFVAVAVVSLAILWPRVWELSANPAELIWRLHRGGRFAGVTSRWRPISGPRSIHAPEPRRELGSPCGTHGAFPARQLSAHDRDGSLDHVYRSEDVRFCLR